MGINWGPVGGVLRASSSVWSPPSPPPSLWTSLPLLLSLTSSSSPHSVSSASSSHTSLCPREHRLESHTCTDTQQTWTASLRKWDKELATPKGLTSVTVLPRLDHMASAAERRSGNRVGRVKEYSGATENVIKMQNKERRKWKRRRWGQREKKTEGGFYFLNKKKKKWVSQWATAVPKERGCCFQCILFVGLPPVSMRQMQPGGLNNYCNEPPSEHMCSLLVNLHKDSLAPGWFSTFLLG